jgi:hypothetical protein
MTVSGSEMSDPSQVVTGETDRRGTIRWKYVHICPSDEGTEGREEPDSSPVMSGPNTVDAILHTGERKS